jgi:hypothetical protein
MTDEYRHDSDSAEHANYLEIERQFSMLVERALKLPKARRILALLSWHAEVVEALKRVGVDPTPEDDTREGTELE